MTTNDVSDTRISDERLEAFLEIARSGKPLGLGADDAISIITELLASRHPQPVNEPADLPEDLRATFPPSLPANWPDVLESRAKAAYIGDSKGTVDLLRATAIYLRAASTPAPERSKEEVVKVFADAILSLSKDGWTEADLAFNSGLIAALKAIRPLLETPPLHKEVEAVAWLHQPTGNVFKDGECQKLIEAWQRQFKDIPADEIAADFIPLYAALSAKPTGEV